METKSKGKRSARKTFAMNDDYQSLDLEALGIVEPAGSPEPEELGEDPCLSSQVDQVVRGLSGATAGGQIYLVEVRQLEPYPDQPFQPYPPHRLQELAEDIAQVGVLSPILTRRIGNRLQILAGHNRWRAAELAGLEKVPVMVLEADDDRAVLILTGTNLRQRENLLPSEKAWAYRMQMEALKRQGQRGDEEYDAAAILTRQSGDSRVQVHRYIRLTYLEAGLLTLLDQGRISMTPAVTLSYLPRSVQEAVLGLIITEGATLTIERAGALREAAEAAPGRELTQRRVAAILQGEGAEPKTGGYLKIRMDRLRELLPQDMGPREAEELILKALKEYGKKRKS